MEMINECESTKTFLRQNNNRGVSRHTVLKVELYSVRYEALAELIVLERNEAQPFVQELCPLAL